MTTIDPANVNVILATDCGSTTTKAIMIERVDGEYRQTQRGEAPTTVEEPFADVTIGVTNSVTEIGVQSAVRIPRMIPERLVTIASAFGLSSPQSQQTSTASAPCT